MKLRFLLGLALFGSVAFAAEPLKVITSTTDLAWAVKKIGGEHVDVKPLLKGKENPHFVDAVPEFIRLASEAKAVFVIGLELEIGWMPKVLARSGNSQVQPGGKGYAEVGSAITVLEKPTGPIDRSMGDVHPGGNPHFWLSPAAFSQCAPVISQTLSKLDPANAAAYDKGLKDFQTLMETTRQRNLKKLQPLLAKTSGPVMLEYHKEFTYFLETYGLKSFGSVEEKPGVAPSAGRLGEIGLAAKAAGVRFVISGDTAPNGVVTRFTEISGIPVFPVPLSVVPSGKWKDYVELQDFIVDTVVKGLQLTPPAKG